MPLMRWTFPLLLLTAACSGSQDTAEESDWKAYLADLKKAEEPSPAVLEPRKDLPLPFWYEGPDASYDAWYGESTGVFPHRPTWRAHRLLAREMEAKGLIRRGASILEVAAPSDDAVDHLIGTTRDADSSARALALFILGDLPDLGKRPELRSRIAPVLMARLTDADQTVRASAAWSLGKQFGDSSAGKADAVAAVASRLQDSDPFVRYAAANTLARLNGATADAIRILKENLTHRNWWVVAGAAASLMRIGKDADAVVPDLLALLRHTNGTVRRNSYAALEAIRPAVLKDNPAAEKVAKEINDLFPHPTTLPPERK